MCTKLGMIVKSNHDQRRTYDTMLAMACIPDALRKKLMGHKMNKRDIDSHYVRIQYSLEELRTALNSAFDNYYKFWRCPRGVQIEVGHPENPENKGI